MPFNNDIDTDLSNDAIAAYMEMAHWLPFGALELRDAFDADELAELRRFRDEICDAAHDNARKAGLIAKYSSLVLKLLRMARIVT